MPVSKTVTISHTLTYIELDIIRMTCNVKLSRRMDGVEFGEYDFAITGNDLSTILMDIPDGSSNLSDSVADCIYKVAIEKGYIQGTIS